MHYCTCKNELLTIDYNTHVIRRPRHYLFRSGMQVQSGEDEDENGFDVYFAYGLAGILFRMGSAKAGNSSRPCMRVSYI